MTAQERDYEDILRRALRAAGESVEPAADGLERIRGRVSARHVSPFMQFTEFLSDWFRPMALWLEESGSAGALLGLAWLRGRVTGIQLPGRGRQALGTGRQRPRAAHRTRPPSSGPLARLRPAFTRLGPAASWLKPVLAVGGAVGIVVAGVFTLGQVQQAITPANQITRNSSTHHPSPPSSAAGVVPATSSAVPSSTAAVSPVKPTATCSPSPKVKVSAPPETSAAPTPTDSASPIGSPTDTSSPSPTPTDSADRYPYRFTVDIADAAGARLLAAPCSSASATAKAAS